MTTSKDFAFPRPTGRYAVGTEVHYYKDESRREIHSKNSSDRRELMITIWYPSKNSKGDCATPYAAEACKQMVYNEFAIPVDTLKPLNEIRTAATPGLPPDNARQYPVILFMPGFICPRTNNTAQCEELASHGYIVVAIDPTYAVAMVQFPDGKIIKHAEIDVLDKEPDEIEQKVWVDDAKYILDQLQILQNERSSLLHGMFDLNNVGMFGHSYGGSTAAQLCRLDKRCKAGLSLDGGLFGKNPTEQFNKPFMFLLAQEWPWANQLPEELKVPHLKYDRIKKLWLEYIPVLCAGQKDMYRIKINGTKHNDFSDLTLIKEMPSFNSKFVAIGAFGSINGFKLTEIVNSYLVNFFDKYLKNEPSSLLDGKAKKYDEVEIIE